MTLLEMRGQNEKTAETDRGISMLDGDIIDLYLKREPDAIRYTSEKYGARLLALSNRLLQDMETAKECENDTYLQAWERIPPNEPREYFFAFLAKIIRHLSLDVCRKKNRQKRNAVIVELSGELEQCIPDRRVTCRRRLTEMSLEEWSVNFSEAFRHSSGTCSCGVTGMQIRWHRLRRNLPARKTRSNPYCSV